jgi:hypothetical protein
MSQLTSESLDFGPLDDRIIETSEQKRLFDDYVRELPPFIGKEIFNFILPNSEFIEFKRINELDNVLLGKKCDWTYGNKYEVAFYNGKEIVNKKSRKFLSRISKKNGKHRYYITVIKKVCDNCGLDMYKCKCNCYCAAYLEDYWSDSKIKVCAACNTYDKYNSLYIGKDIGKALIELLF